MVVVVHKRLKKKRFERENGSVVQLIEVQENNNIVGCQLRACFHSGGGPQVDKVTRLGGVTRLSISF